MVFLLEMCQKAESVRQLDRQDKDSRKRVFMPST